MKVAPRKVPQVRWRIPAVIFLVCAVTVGLTGCGFRFGSPEANEDASDEVLAAQLKIEDQAWALRSNFFRPDFGPEWREIRDAGADKPTMGLPFQTCLAAAQGSDLDPATISADAGSPRFTRPNGAFAASNALVTTDPAVAASLYELSKTPEFTTCVAQNTIDFRANPPVATADTSPLDMDVSAGDSTSTQVNLTYPARGANEEFVADFTVVQVDRALLALWFANPGTPTVQADEDAVIDALVARLTTLPDEASLTATTAD
jgi:hypothetical protein